MLGNILRFIAMVIGFLLASKTEGAKDAKAQADSNADAASAVLNRGSWMQKLRDKAKSTD